MDSAQEQKIGRYIKNSTRFLFGLPPTNYRGKRHRRGDKVGPQEAIYDWLEEVKKYEFERFNYEKVAAQLVREPGVERLLTEVIIPRVLKRLGSDGLLDDDLLYYLRTCWNQGHRPEMAELYDRFRITVKKGESWPYAPFLEVNTQYRYVERVGELAGLWFEEIEPSGLVPAK